ncbi:MAG: hypothetical protein ACYDDF_15320 [Thermoplasmatota archaeon]
MKVPAFMLKKLYVAKSLKNDQGNVTFRLKNTLANATMVKAPRISIDGEAIVDKALQFESAGQKMAASEITLATPIEFKKGSEVLCTVQGRSLPAGSHKFHVDADTKEWETLSFDFEDAPQP